MSYPFGGNFELRLVHPDKLKPDPRNARKHPKRQIDQICASMSEFGFTNPIVVDEEGAIIAGHGRLLAAKQLGLTEAPVIVISGLTDAQKRRLRLADNKIALNSGWDREQLAVELRELSIEIPDLVIPGFETGEIDALIVEPVEANDDTIPAVPKIAVSRPGDVVVLGRHRVVCGDCRDPSLMQRLMGGAKADAAFLDPPFNVRIDGHAGGKGRIKHREFAFASGEMSPEAFVRFLEETLGACAAVSRNGAVHFVCMDHHHIDELIEACRKIYGSRLNICVWNKSNGGMGSLYRSKHELVFVYRVGDAPHFNAVELGKHGRNRTNVWDAPSVNTFGGRSSDLELHPTVKPAGLVAEAIMDVTRRGETVLDAFLGSGTTLIACERTGRVCFGVEIDPAYVDVIVERFFLTTGQRAVLEGTGQTFEETRALRKGQAEGNDDERQ